MASVIIPTIGPLGRNVIIEKEYSSPIISNDSVAISGQIDSLAGYDNIGASFIKELTTKVSKTVGDGSSTAVLLTYHILKSGIKNITAGANPILLKSGMTKALSEVKSSLSKQTRLIESESDTKAVAVVAAKDDEIGALIADAIDKTSENGVVMIEEAKSRVNHVEVIDGMRIDRGYISPQMITNYNDLKANLENPFILLSDYKISDPKELLPVLEEIVKLEGNLLVIADEVEADALNVFLTNKAKGILPNVCIRAPEFSERRKEAIRDIAIATGGTVISEDYGMKLTDTRLEHLGKARAVEVSKDTTLIVGGCGNKSEIEKRLNEIENKISNVDFDFDKLKLQDRYNKLSGRIVMLKVGADTARELSEKKVRAEKALKATQSAIHSGVLPGGGKAYYNAISSLDDYIISMSGDEATGAIVLRDALLSLVRQIAINSDVDPYVVCEELSKVEDTWFGYDAKQKKYVDLNSVGVLDASNVLATVITSAVSMSSTILTTNAIVRVKEEVE